MKNKLHSFCTYIIMALLVFISMHCFSQDTIVMHNGRQILGKVLEVSLTEVKYKKAELLEGPLYIEDKARIAKIKYEGGYVDLLPIIDPPTISRQLPGAHEYEKISEKYPSLTKTGSTYIYDKNKVLTERRMHEVLLAVNNPEITKQIRNAKLSKGLRYVGFVAVPLGLLAGLMFINHYPGYGGQESSYNSIYGVAAAAGVAFGASVYFNIDYKYRNARAMRLYQQNYILKK